VRWYPPKETYYSAVISAKRDVYNRCTLSAHDTRRESAASEVVSAHSNGPAIYILKKSIFPKRDLLHWMISAKWDVYNGIADDGSRHRSTASEAAFVRYSNPLYVFSKRNLLQWMITANRDVYSGITYDWSRHRSTASEAASLRHSNPLLFILKKRPITVNDTRKQRPIQRYYLRLVTTQVYRIRGSFFTLQ